jgi:predicted nucleic acid-binding protein
MHYLIDTNVISETIRARPDKHLMAWFKTVPDEALYVSALSIGEIRKGIQKNHDSQKREKLRQWLENNLMQSFENRIISIDLAVAERWGKLVAAINRPLAVVDSLLAATALHHDLILVTRNVKDFNFPGLDVFNPWEYES